MEGFYLVYLFASDGSRLYLSLNQGTSEFRSGHMRPVNNPIELLARGAEGRRALRDSEASDVVSASKTTIDLAADSTLGIGQESRTRTLNYEHANIYAKEYAAGGVPADEELLWDVRGFLPLLAVLYGIDSGGRSARRPSRPLGGRAPARQSSPGQGRVSDPATRRAIERYAEDAAVQALQGEWQVARVGHLRRGYDLECTRDDLVLHVEVKGTQSLGEEVVLTRNEVNHHAIHGGRCTALHGLFVLSRVHVTRGATPRCSGGVPQLLEDWSPELDALTPTEYSYRLPRSAQEGVRRARQRA
jgi:hypothetical protein